jgi:ABC-type lipoprotein release transport system permease subunit
MAMFLLESASLGLVATTLGALLALAIASVLGTIGIPLPEGPLRTFMMAEHLTLAVTYVHVVASIVVVTLVTMSASLWPALRAARLEPVTAIQRVN